MMSSPYMTAVLSLVACAAAARAARALAGEPERAPQADPDVRSQPAPTPPYDWAHDPWFADNTQLRKEAPNDRG